LINLLSLNNLVSLKQQIHAGIIFYPKERGIFMKKVNHFTTVVLSVLILVILLTGGYVPVPQQQQESKKAEASQPAQTTQAAQPAQTTQKTVTEPVKIEFIQQGNITDNDPGMQAIISYIQEQARNKFNIDLDMQIISKNVYESKINVMWVSGEVPDIVQMGDAQKVKEGVDNGGFVPIDEYLDKLSDWSKVDRTYFKSSMFNGRIYAFPKNLGAPNGLCYREDWAERLNLKIPTNAEELYQMLKAFAKNDPDNDGVDSTVGFTMEKNFQATDPLWRLFIPRRPNKLGQYVDENDDTVKSVFLLADQMKEALAWFNRAYVEGVLDQEWVVENKGTEEDKFITGKTGVWSKGVDLIPARQETMKKANPNAVIGVLPPIQGPYGPNYTIAAEKSTDVYVTTKCQHPDKAVEFLAYYFGPEGIKDNTYGKEGTHYKIENGKFVWLDENVKSSHNPALYVGYLFVLVILADDPVLKKGLSAVAGYKVEIPTALPDAVLESEVYQNKAADLEKLAKETLASIIIGEKPVSYYDKFLEEAKAIGLDETLEDLNRIYKQIK